MPQKWSRKIEACCADNASFLTVWVSGAKKGWYMTLSLFLFFLRCKCIYYAAGWNLFAKKVNFFPLSFTIYWKGQLFIQLSLLQHQSSSQSWCIYPHRIIWRRDNTLIYILYTAGLQLRSWRIQTQWLAQQYMNFSATTGPWTWVTQVCLYQQLKELFFQTNTLLKTHNSLLNWFLGLPNVCSCQMTPWIILRMIWSRHINKSIDGYKFFSCSAISLLIVSHYGVISETEKVGIHQLARKGLRALAPKIPTGVICLACWKDGGLVMFF